MITGEPIVKNDMYINHIRILLDAIPIFSPIEAHTPNAFNSKKARILSISVCNLVTKSDLTKQFFHQIVVNLHNFLKS